MKIAPQSDEKGVQGPPGDPEGTRRGKMAEKSGFGEPWGCQGVPKWSQNGAKNCPKCERKNSTEKRGLPAPFRTTFGSLLGAFLGQKRSGSGLGAIFRRKGSLRANTVIYYDLGGFRRPGGEQKSTLGRILGIKNGAENGAEKNTAKTAFGSDFGSILGPKTDQNGSKNGSENGAEKRAEKGAIGRESGTGGGPAETALLKQKTDLYGFWNGFGTTLDLTRPARGRAD